MKKLLLFLATSLVVTASLGHAQNLSFAPSISAAYYYNGTTPAPYTSTQTGPGISYPLSPIAIAGYNSATGQWYVCSTTSPCSGPSGGSQSSGGSANSATTYSVPYYSGSTAISGISIAGIPLFSTSAAPRPVVVGDIVGLFGTCTATQFLSAAGNCVTVPPAPPLTYPALAAYSASATYPQGALILGTVGSPIAPLTNVYQSQVSGNTGNAVTNTTYWQPIASAPVITNSKAQFTVIASPTASSSAVTMAAIDAICSGAGGNCTVTVGPGFLMGTGAVSANADTMPNIRLIGAGKGMPSSTPVTAKVASVACVSGACTAQTPLGNTFSANQSIFLAGFTANNNLPLNIQNETITSASATSFQFTSGSLNYSATTETGAWASTPVNVVGGTTILCGEYLATGANQRTFDYINFDVSASYLTNGTCPAGAAYGVSFFSNYASTVSPPIANGSISHSLIVVSSPGIAYHALLAENVKNFMATDVDVVYGNDGVVLKGATNSSFRHMSIQSTPTYCALMKPGTTGYQQLNMSDNVFEDIHCTPNSPQDTAGINVDVQGGNLYRATFRDLFTAGAQHGFNLTAENGYIAYDLHVDNLNYVGPTTITNQNYAVTINGNMTRPTFTNVHSFGAYGGLYVGSGSVVAGAALLSNAGFTDDQNSDIGIYSGPEWDIHDSQLFHDPIVTLPAVTVALSGSAASTCTVTNPGSGVYYVPTVTLTAPTSGTAATVTLQVSNFQVSGCTLNPNTGVYSAAPTATVSTAFAGSQIAAFGSTTNVVDFNGTFTNVGIRYYSDGTGAYAGLPLITNVNVPLSGRVNFASAFSNSAYTYDTFLSRGGAGTINFGMSGNALGGTLQLLADNFWAPSASFFSGLKSPTGLTVSQNFLFPNLGSVTSATLSAARFLYCGATAACSATSEPLPLTEYGQVTLASGAATVTGLVAFTSTATFSCRAQDVTTPANIAYAVPASVSSITVSGTSTDVISYSCTGH